MSSKKTAADLASVTTVPAERLNATRQLQAVLTQDRLGAVHDSECVGRRTEQVLASELRPLWSQTGRPQVIMP